MLSSVWDSLWHFRRILNLFFGQSPPTHPTFVFVWRTRGTHVEGTWWDNMTCMNRSKSVSISSLASNLLEPRGNVRIVFIKRKPLNPTKTTTQPPCFSFFETTEKQTTTPNKNSNNNNIHKNTNDSKNQTTMLSNEPKPASHPTHQHPHPHKPRPGLKRKSSSRRFRITVNMLLEQINKSARSLLQDHEH